MSIHITISLEKRRKGQDGTFMIVYRLGHFRKTTVIASGFRVLEKDWDAKRRQVRKTHKGTLSVSRINQQLLNQKALYLERIEQLKQANQLKGLTAIELKELLTRKRDSNSFFE
ncbi:MAG: Arm DNA-binding domain-containing protein, partial [Bacteroidota bacterium]